MLTIPETLAAQSDAAVAKADALRAPLRFTVSAMLAGAYIGIGVVLMVSTAGPLAAAGDGLAKLVAGLVFGVALTLVVFAGGDLVTSAMMTLPIGALLRTVTPWRATVTVLATFAANLAGALVFAALVAVSGVLHANPAAGSMLHDLLAAKAHETPVELLARGVLCNVLVCLAIWMCTRVHSEVAKIVLIFVAILPFISSGFEHVVANMTTYGIGLLTGAEHATWPLFGANLLWVGLGNLAGGLLVAGAYRLVGGAPRDAAATASVPRREGAARLD